MPLNSTRLELTAVPRPPESNQGNLFVRLTPQTALNLASLLDDTLSDNNIIGILGELQHDVHFLPLEIVLHQRDKCNADTSDDDNCIKIYASYNGGAPATKVIGYNHDIIELPLDIHPSLKSVFNSTSEPVIVSVRPLSYVPIAERVTFEPLSIQDWELIEMEANLLEDGGLLNQITIVSPGQVFPLRFAGHLSSLESAAWIKVVDEEFNTTIRSNQQRMDTVSFASISSSDSEFADSSTESHEEDNSTNGKTNGCSNSYKYQCVRLMAETEVAVIPKPRIKREELIDNKESNASCKNEEPIFCPSKSLRIQPIARDILRCTNLSADEYSSFPNPSIGFVSVHPSTLIQLPGYRQCNQLISQQHENGSNDLELPQMYVTIRKANTQCSNKNSTNEPDNVVACIIQASTLVHKGHIGMHQLLRHQLGVIPLKDWISVQIWTESHVTSSISRIRDGTEKIEITKVSSFTEKKHSTSMHSWNYPDGYSYCSQISTQSTCNHCSNSIVPTKVNGTCNLLAQIFSSGCIIPVGYLQEIGLDGLDGIDEQDSSDMYILKIKPNVDKHPCTSEIISMITANDLKGLEVSNIQVDGNDNKEVLVVHVQSSLLPFSNKQTVGFNKAIETIQQSSRQILSSNYRFTRFASTSIHNHAIMITGEEGSGKTHLSVTAASQLYVSDLLPTIYLDCKKLQATSTNIQTILEEVQKSFQEAVRKQPSVLILDCLDTLIPNVGSSDTEGSLQHQQLNPALAAQVKIIVDHLVIQSQFCSRSYVSDNEYSGGNNTGVVLLCTCRDKDSISTRYQESGVFHSLVEVPSLDASQRAQFLYNNVFGSRSPDDRIPHAITRLGKVTDGFRPKDLKVISTRIVHVDYLRNIQHASQVDTGSESSLNIALESGDVASILEDYSPLSQQMVDIDHNSCLLDWESVGGLHKAKQSLHDSVIHPVVFKSVYEQAPISLPTGILLYGPSGNGKSFIVPILAKKSKLNLITCRGPELLDRYIGASEAKVRQLFARASAAAPCIIFFDDFDALAPQRGSDNTGVTDRVVNQLLTLLDGAESDKKTHNIFIVAATSRPDKIDKALLRPGRLEKHIYVGYPESLLEWNSLFSSLLIDRNVDEEVSQIRMDGDLFNSFCVQDCAYARDFSAADMKAVLDTAHLLCVHDILNGTKDRKEEKEEEYGPAILSKDNILEAFRRTRPSLLPKDRHILQRIYSRFGSKEKNGESESDKSESRHSLKTALR